MRVTRELFELLQTKPVFKGKIVSDSMIPVIKPGDVITVTVGEKNLRRFDIIVFYHDESLTCHVLWQRNQVIKPILMRTKNMKNEMDLPVSENDYLGKVTSHQLNLFQKLKLFF
jgi:signal peptidase I